MALLPPDYLDSVVAIGNESPNGKINWLATGFLLGRFLKKIDDGTHDYQAFLITNKHVVKDLKSMKIRLNPKTSEIAKDYSVKLFDEEGERLWIGHPDETIDIAILGINLKKARKEGMNFHIFRSDFDIASINQMKEKGVSEGDLVYGLGFPMGFVDPNRQYVIVRSGSIARIRDLFEGYRKDFLVDLFVFPGNSGGPIIIRPEISHVERTKSIGYPYLIGMVQSYVTYRDIAWSQQTGKPRVVFEENSGLASVIPIQYVLEIIENIPIDLPQFDE